MKNIICFTEACKEFPYGVSVYKIEVSKVIFSNELIWASKKDRKILNLVSVITPNNYIYDFILDEYSKYIQVGDSVIFFPSMPRNIVEIIKRKKR